jgi:hypothetical protein
VAQDATAAVGARWRRSDRRTLDAVERGGVAIRPVTVNALSYSLPQVSQIAIVDFLSLPPKLDKSGRSIAGDDAA